MAVSREALSQMVGTRFALSGGSTFSALFPLWRPSIAERVRRGEALKFFPVDERMVAYDAPGCNWKICTEELLEPAGLGAQQAHHAVSVPGFRDMLDSGLSPDGRFDAVFLGMGDDGHTASLFPGGEYLADQQSLVLETWSPKPPYPRLTLGLRPLWEAHRLVAIVLGEGKADMVARLRAGDDTLPITRALSGHPDPVLILDEGAASKV